MNAENYVQVNSEDATCESSAITLTKNPADSIDDLFIAKIGSSQTPINVLYTDA